MSRAKTPTQACDLAPSCCCCPVRHCPQVSHCLPLSPRVTTYLDSRSPEDGSPSADRLSKQSNHSGGGRPPWAPVQKQGRQPSPHPGTQNRPLCSASWGTGVPERALGDPARTCHLAGGSTREARLFRSAEGQSRLWCGHGEVDRAALLGPEDSAVKEQANSVRTGGKGQRAARAQGHQSRPSCCSAVCERSSFPDSFTLSCAEGFVDRSSWSVQESTG